MLLGNKAIHFETVPDYFNVTTTRVQNLLSEYPALYVMVLRVLDDVGIPCLITSRNANYDQQVNGTMRARAIEEMPVLQQSLARGAM